MSRELNIKLPDEFESRELNLAALWAAADGCEGAEYLQSLCACASMAQPGYGYCYADETAHEQILLALIREQVNAMRRGALSGEQGWDPEFVKDILALETES